MSSSIETVPKPKVVFENVPGGRGPVKLKKFEICILIQGVWDPIDESPVTCRCRKEMAELASEMGKRINRLWRVRLA